MSNNKKCRTAFHKFRDKNKTHAQSNFEFLSQNFGQITHTLMSVRKWPNAL